MKKVILLLGVFLITSAINAQVSISIVDPTNPSVDLNNTMIDKSGSASDFEIVKSLWLINNTNQNLTLKCKKIEVDVLAGTENVTCWKICPMNYDVAGANPSAFVTINGVEMTENFDPNGSASGNDTVKSFAGHYRPMNIDGCSLMRYEFYDVNNPNTPLASVDIRFIHTSGTCTVSDDIVAEIPEFKLFPNPANELLNFQVDNLTQNLNNLSFSIVDIIGKTVLYRELDSFKNSSSQIDVSLLKQGVYIVSMSDGENILQTQRLIIKR
ncbi:MAG: hypothetical protein CMD01_04290 [Flavobacteriales bacterium]|nr:hypothetical protein [Flavobacteriales bacterium]